MENQNIQPPIPAQEPSTTPVSNISQTPPPSPIKPSRKFSIKIIIGIVVFLLLAGGAAAGYIYRKPLGLVSTPTPSPSPTIADSPTPDPNADWQTYTDEDFNFSLKYPDSWQINENREEQRDENLIKDISFRSPAEDTSLVLQIQENENFTDNLDYLEFIKEGYPDNIDFKEIEADGIKSIVTTNLAGAFGTLTYGSTAGFYNNGNTYSIIIHSKEENGSQEELLLKILSTFKFTELTLSPTPTLAPRVTHTPTPNPTANWKTYTKGNLSFKYPQSWHTGIAEDGTILLNDKTFDETLVMEPDQVAITLEIIADPQLIKLYSDTGIYKNKKKIGEYDFEITDTMTNSYAQVKFARNIYNGIMYRFGLTNLKDEGIFNQILATFKLNN